MIQTRSCPNCLRKVDVSAFELGARVRCPYCRKEFEVQAQRGPAPRPERPSKNAATEPTEPPIHVARNAA